MRPLSNHSSHTAAILTLSEIAAAIEAFNRGDANVYDALEAILIEVEAYQAAARPRRDAA